MEGSIEQTVVKVFLMVDLGNFKVTVKNGLLRSLNGRLVGVHNVLCSAADRVQRTTRFLLGTRQWLHDSGAQEN